ncbi:MAG: hypothetical protein ISS16_09095 [Ignavibacteria bacterium]|nr:hypothetical protein [Ignavibacteria bacterium]
MEFLLKAEHSTVYIIIVTIVAALLSYFFYRNSSIKNPLKFILQFIRFLAIWLIFLLLLSPVLSFFSEITQKPINIFLIDNSLSLNIENRDSLTTDLLNNIIPDIENNKSENKYFLFSKGLEEEIKEDEFDSIKFTKINNLETNLSTTLLTLLEKYENKNISSVNIISDGIINSGGNPSHSAKMYNIPINYFLIGDTIQKPDLLVKDIFFNKVTFVESQTPLKIEINSYGFDKKIKVNLYEDSNLINYQFIDVNSNSNSYDISFKLSSPVEAIKKYKIEVEEEPNEITFKNNYRELFTKYIDNKFKVLVLSGGPSADFAFISEEIKNIENFEAEFRTQKTANEFYEGQVPDLNNFQAFIFIGYPTSISNISLLNDIKESIERNESSLFFIASRNTDYKKLSLLENNLPFKAVSISESEKEIGVKTVSSITQDAIRNLEVLKSVNSLPNLFKSGTVFSINPESETILISSSGEPMLVIQNTAKNKSAAFLGHGLYKWRLTPGITNSEQVLNAILTGVIISITDKEKRKKFSINTSKQVYSPYENIKFTGTINDITLKGGMKIKIKIYNDDFNERIELQKVGNFDFEGLININTTGDYYYTGELYSKGRLIESDTKKLSIGENNYEYKYTRSDKSILNYLSLTTGGRDFTNMEINKINDFIIQVNSQETETVISSENIFLNFNLYYLFIIILLLTTEWVLRKRNNLP